MKRGRNSNSNFVNFSRSPSLLKFQNPHFSSVLPSFSHFLLIFYPFSPNFFSTFALSDSHLSHLHPHFTFNTPNLTPLLPSSTPPIYPCYAMNLLPFWSIIPHLTLNYFVFFLISPLFTLIVPSFAPILPTLSDLYPYFSCSNPIFPP